MRKWINVGLESDIKGLLISGKFNMSDALKVVESMRNEMIDTFGISQDTRKILLTKMEIERKYMKVLLDNDKSQMAFIKILEKQLEQQFVGSKSSDYDYFSSVSIMIKEGLTRKDSETITVYEYYNNLKILEKWHKTK